jgi:hypothetical protein
MMLDIDLIVDTEKGKALIAGHLVEAVVPHPEFEGTWKLVMNDVQGEFTVRCSPTALAAIAIQNDEEAERVRVLDVSSSAIANPHSRAQWLFKKATAPKNVVQFPRE